mmetsp:Transcript_3511/g.13429  ORF Transcript_3511/g.13429 Transcript_3511/m.13429 type:complete len:880 (+) Transcript_3511:1-2640(+)
MSSTFGPNPQITHLLQSLSSKSNLNTISSLFPSNPPPSTLFTLSPHIQSHPRIQALPYGSLFSSYYVPYLHSQKVQEQEASVTLSDSHSKVSLISGEFGAILNERQVRMALIGENGTFEALETVRIEASRVFVVRRRRDTCLLRSGQRFINEQVGEEDQKASTSLPSSVPYNVCLFVENQQMISSAVWEDHISSTRQTPHTIQADERLFQHLNNNTKSRENMDGLLEAQFVAKMDALGQTLIHHLAFDGNETDMRLLLELGVPPIQLDFMDRTPLHIACARNHTKTCIMLLESAGQETLGRLDVYGETPLDMAQRYGHRELVKKLNEWSERKKLGIIFADEDGSRKRHSSAHHPTSRPSTLQVPSPQPRPPPSLFQSPQLDFPSIQKSPLIFVSSQERFRIESLRAVLEKKYGEIIYCSLLQRAHPWSPTSPSTTHPHICVVCVFRQVPQDVSPSLTLQNSSSMPTPATSLLLIQPPWDLFEHALQSYFVTSRDSYGLIDMDEEKRRTILLKIGDMVQHQGNMFFDRLVQIQLIKRDFLRLHHVSTPLCLLSVTSCIFQEEICIADIRQLLEFLSPSAAPPSALQDVASKNVAQYHSSFTPIHHLTLISCVSHFCRMIWSMWHIFLGIRGECKAYAQVLVIQLLRKARNVNCVLQTIDSSSSARGHILTHAESTTKKLPFIRSLIRHALEMKQILQRISSRVRLLELRIEQYEEGTGFGYMLDQVVQGHMDKGIFLEHWARVQRNSGNRDVSNHVSIHIEDLFGSGPEEDLVQKPGSVRSSSNSSDMLQAVIQCAILEKSLFPHMQLVGDFIETCAILVEKEEKTNRVPSDILDERKCCQILSKMWSDSLSVHRIKTKQTMELMKQFLVHSDPHCSSVK